MKTLPANKNLAGQTILIVLLIMAVILTVALSTISTSITDIKISQETEEASRAYYVAESAIEEQLLLFAKALPSTAGEIDNIDYEVTKADLGGGKELTLPNPLSANQTQTIWLIDHNEDGTLKETSFGQGTINVNFGSLEVGGTMPAIAVVQVYKDNSGSFQIKRKNCDPSGSRRDPNGTTTNNFDSAVDLAADSPFRFQCPVAVGGAGQTPYLLKIALLYNDNPQPVGLDSTNNLPRQGYCFESTAKVPPSGVTRKIKQCKTWPDLPEIFSWGLFSRGDLIKQIF